MMNLKKLPNEQLGFFLLRYSVWVSNEYTSSLDNIIGYVENMVSGDSIRANHFYFEIADSNIYAKDKIKKLNKWIDETRSLAEKREFYELCFNLSKVNYHITAGLTLYDKVETY